MKNKILLSILAIGSIFSSCGDSKKEEFKISYPEKKLGVVKAQYSDGSIAIGAFNRGYNNYNEKSNYPWSLKITVSLDSINCTSNGLPLEDESKIANQFEEKLVQDMSKISPLHNVGHLFNANNLDIYLYVRDKGKIEEWILTESKKETIRPFNFEIAEDEDWAIIEHFMNDK